MTVYELAALGREQAQDRQSDQIVFFEPLNRGLIGQQRRLDRRYRRFPMRFQPFLELPLYISLTALRLFLDLVLRELPSFPLHPIIEAFSLMMRPQLSLISLDWIHGDIIARRLALAGHGE